MNILFIHEVDWLKKVVFELHTLAELLSLRGHRVYAIDYESMWKREGLFDFGSFKTKTIEKVARAYPEASVCLKRPGFIKVPGLSRLSAIFTEPREIERTIKEAKIDAVVLYSVATSGWQTISLARKFGVPVLFRSIDVSNQLVPHRVLRPLTRVLEKKVYSGADLVLTLSPKLSGYVVSMGTPADKVDMLPLGVDTAVFRPHIDCVAVSRKWSIGREDQVAVFVGTLFDFSGLDVLIRQFPQVLAAAPQARLLIVGDGPQRRALDGLIAALGLHKQVTITGFQPYETMPSYINMADVCLNTFLVNGVTRDICPTKIIQYLACARPVLSSPLPGTKALIEGEGQGVVYADPEKMAGELVALLRSPERRQKLGQAGMDYVSRVHSYDRIVERLEAILVHLASRKR